MGEDLLVTQGVCGSIRLRTSTILEPGAWLGTLERGFGPILYAQSSYVPSVYIA